jgi:hypothetical protein
MVPFYPIANQALSLNFPTSASASTLALASGTTLTSVSTNTFSAGTVIPAGEYKFEHWTDGSSGADVLTVDVGYCTPPSCTNPVSFLGGVGWSANVAANDPGTTSTFTTSSATTLPAGGPYDIYVKINVQSATTVFNLLYNSLTQSSNVALPRPSSLTAAPNSSVLFVNGGNLQSAKPTGSSPSLFSLKTKNNALTLASARTFAAGEVIPPGAWEFQFWSDGSATDPYAEVQLEFGYCSSSCTVKYKIIDPTSSFWKPRVLPQSSGAAVAGGAFTTTSSTTLPPGGPYQLYLIATVSSPQPFNLLYGSAGTPTNLATPFVTPLGTGMGAQIQKQRNVR